MKAPSIPFNIVKDMIKSARELMDIDISHTIYRIINDTELEDSTMESRIALAVENHFSDYPSRFSERLLSLKHVFDAGRDNVRKEK